MKEFQPIKEGKVREIYAFLLFHHQDISILVYQFQHRMFKLTVMEDVERNDRENRHGESAAGE